MNSTVPLRRLFKAPAIVDNDIKTVSLDDYKGLC